jgi:hypothetical protein
MTREKEEKFLTILFGMIVVGMIISAVHDTITCHKKDGEWVRGAITEHCVTK